MSLKPMMKAGMVAAMIAGMTGPAHAALTQLDGAGGGGIIPWALLSGDSAKSNYGIVASDTFVSTGDFDLNSIGVAGSIMHRVEISYAHWHLSLPADLQTGLGLSSLEMNVVGAKVKLLDMSDTLPQVAFGVQYKQDSSDVIENAGLASHSSGVDYYLAATKVFPVAGKNVLVDATVRATKANQFGLLGFGSPGNDSYSAEFEGTAGVFLNPQTMAGVEYRTKPNNIQAAGFQEDSAADAFIAYFPNDNLSLAVAYATLGNIAGHANQQGLYLQAQASF